MTVKFAGVEIEKRKNNYVRAREKILAVKFAVVERGRIMTYQENQEENIGGKIWRCRERKEED